MNRAEYRRMADTRLREARVLLHAGAWSGAYYLGGYAAECGLKACIAGQFRRSELPDRSLVNRSYSHHLVQLVDVAGLAAALATEERGDGDFADNWTTVREWNVESRYLVWSRPEAEALYRALADPRHGVMRWLRRYW